MALALIAAFLWGVISIIISPCQLASIPLIVGYINEQGKIKIRRAFLISLIFSGGIIFTITFVGVITSLSGRIIGDIGSWAHYLIAVVFIIIGLIFIDLIKLPYLCNIPHLYKRKGLLAAFIFGLIFGVALGPCTFAFIAPILVIVFTAGMNNFFYGLFLILAYALGYSTVLILAGTFTKFLEKYLRWNEQSQVSIIIKRICGALIIIGGIYLIFYGR
jgi:cytochrome c-type biogenesis protein